MKRCIFVIDDKLDDVGGLLLSIQGTLYNAGLQHPESQDRVKVFFIHICWDVGSTTLTRTNDSEFFDKEKGQLKNRIEEGGYSFVIEPVYKRIELENATYTEASCKKMAQEVIKHQKEILKETYGDDKLSAMFPRVDSAMFSYDVLLDIILNLNADKDTEIIPKSIKPLSGYLYEEFSGDHCCMYTNYVNHNYTESWMKTMGIIGEDRKPIQRSYLSNARGIVRKLKEHLCQALIIDQGGGGGHA